jgi:hypothetical protein
MQVVEEVGVGREVCMREGWVCIGARGVGYVSPSYLSTYRPSYLPTYLVPWGDVCVGYRSTYRKCKFLEAAPSFTLHN